MTGAARPRDLRAGRFGERVSPRRLPPSVARTASGPDRDQIVQPTRMFRKTSWLTREPANIRSTPRNSPRKNDQVTLKRSRPLVTPGMKAPAAIRIVAGTPGLSLAWGRADGAAGRGA